jgi:MFS family permease
VRDGVRVVFSDPGLRDLLLLGFLVGLAGVNFTVGLPVLVRQELGDDARLFGYLAATFGLGALVAAVFSAARTTPTKGLLFASVWMQAVGLAACGASSQLGVVVPGIFLSGWMQLTLAVTLNASLQLGAPREYRGRVIGLYFLVTFGSNVVGGPVIGWLAEREGAATAFAASAGLTAAVAIGLAVRWWRRLSEPVAQHLGPV